jgi:hypothetical protein
MPRNRRRKRFKRPRLEPNSHAALTVRTPHPAMACELAPGTFRSFGKPRKLIRNILAVTLIAWAITVAIAVRDGAFAPYTVGAGSFALACSTLLLALETARLDLGARALRIRSLLGWSDVVAIDDLSSFSARIETVGRQHKKEILVFRVHGRHGAALASFTGFEDSDAIYDWLQRRLPERAPTLQSTLRAKGLID